MCGIMGCLERREKVDAGVVHEMMELLRHRGPDDNGYEQFAIAGGELGMGFVRLSICDLSPAGHQPMFNKTDDIAITLNGEIYNADDLRQPLLDAGYTFSSTSDTEVLLDLYELYGIDKMLSMLDGMFAICIVDMRNNCFYLIRDRLGEKPLYTWDDGETLLYASEYKAFYCHPRFKAELNENAVDEYFLFRYVSDGDTLLKGVSNLQPGSYLKVEADGVHKTVYWKFPDVEPNKMSFEENKDCYDKLLKTSLRRRLISDRKVGLQLSGGVDSSYLAHIAQPMIEERLHTFSITFKDKRYSEEQYQENVIKKENCVPHNFEYSPKMFFDCWRECTWYFEAPMNHEGTLGLLYLNRRSKEYVTVMLCGEGSDEVLGGYGEFYLQEKIRKNKFFQLSKRWLFSMLQTRTISLPLSYKDALIHNTQFVSDDVFMKLRKRGRDAIKRVYAKRRSILNDSGQKVKGARVHMNYEARTYMQDLLMRADKTSMASSIEVRVPFIMPELVEFACQIPDEQLVDTGKDINRGTKRVIKELCSSVYGEDFTYRKKSGFAAPVSQLFCAPEVSKFIESTILPGIEQRGIVKYMEVKKMWEENKKNNGGIYKLQWPLWCAFSFELWAQMYLDNKPQGWKHIIF